MNKKIIAAAIAGTAIGGYLVADHQATKAAEAQLTKTLEDVKPFMDVNYDAVDVGLLSGKLTISDVTFASKLSGENISVDEIVIHDVDQDHSIPRFMTVSINGITAEIPKNGKVARDLKKLGYENQLVGDIHLSYHYDFTEKELEIDELSTTIDDMGEVTIDLHLGNLPSTMASSFFGRSLMEQVVLHEANIKYEDDSLTERKLKIDAERMGVSTADLKKEITADIEKEIAKTQSKKAKSFLKEIIEFIDDPEELAISINPEEPTSMKTLLRTQGRQTDDLVKLLNIDVEA